MSLYQKIKYDNANESAELNMGLVIPPDYQCGNVDHMQRAVSDILRTLDYGLRQGDEDSLVGAIEDASFDLNYLPDLLEELREAIIEVRAWGEDWKYIAKKFINELPEEQVLDLLGYEFKEEHTLEQTSLF